MIAAISKAALDASARKEANIAQAALLTNPLPMNFSVPRASVATRPPGPAPAGKIWSTEHGHWHDLPNAGTTATAFTPGPQPPGPVPAGKVWSPEHGHWHDAPESTLQTITATSEPQTVVTTDEASLGPVLDSTEVEEKANVAAEAEPEPLGPVRD